MKFTKGAVTERVMILKQSDIQDLLTELDTPRGKENQANRRLRVLEVIEAAFREFMEHGDNKLQDSDTEAA